MPTVLMLFLLVLAPLRAQAATDTAEAFVYPMRVWQLVTEQGDQLWNGYYHMGVDLGGELGEGAPVYAIADGVVKESRIRTSFGLVILIEHTLPNGQRVVSLYGHLKPTDTPVHAGQKVKMGDRIGSLGNSAENGGWSPHLHFGIHKQAYSSTWIYYGHVKSASTAEKWYEPGSFIAERLSKDSWKPTVALNLSSSSYVGDTLRFTVDAQDLGSGVESVVVELSQNNRQTWNTVAQFGSSSSYPYRVVTGLPNIDSGNSYVRVTAIDGKNQRTETMVRLTRDINMSTSQGPVVIRNSGGGGLTYLTYQSGGIVRAITPFSSSWKQAGDIAVGNVTGDATNELIVVKAGVDARVTVLTDDGTKLKTFKAFGYKKQSSARVTTGDVTGDGKDEIIVGFGKGKQKTIRVFDANGTLLRELTPFSKTVSQGVDVAAGDVNGDGIDEIIVGQRAGKSKTRVAVLSYATGTRIAEFNAIDKHYKKGVNVAAGDVDKDGKAEVIVGAQKTSRGSARVVVIEPLTRKAKRTVYTPYGGGFAGTVDVATMDYDGDGQQEIVMSQASGGPAIVKTYRFNAAQTVLSDEWVFQAGYKKGARVAGWK